MRKVVEPFSMIGAILVFVLGMYLIARYMEPDPNEPRWRFNSYREYDYQEVHVSENHVSFVTKQGNIHEYIGEVTTSDRLRKIQVIHWVNDNSTSFKIHGYSKWKVNVPK